MEGEIGAVLGLCLDGWWVGWLCGKELPCPEVVSTGKLLTKFVHRLY